MNLDELKVGDTVDVVGLKVKEIDEKEDIATVMFSVNGMRGWLPKKCLPSVHKQEKIILPEEVANWLRQCKNERKCLASTLGLARGEVGNWLLKHHDWYKNQDLFARAWLNPELVEIGQKKRYRVKMRGLAQDKCFLNYDEENNEWSFNTNKEQDTYFTGFTQKELKEAGYGGVFYNPLFEVEEVE